MSQSIYTAIANFLGEALQGFSSVEAYTKNKKSWCLTAVVVVLMLLSLNGAGGSEGLLG